MFFVIWRSEFNETYLDSEFRANLQHLWRRCSALRSHCMSNIHFWCLGLILLCFVTEICLLRQASIFARKRPYLDFNRWQTKIQVLRKGKASRLVSYKRLTNGIKKEKFDSSQKLYFSLSLFIFSDLQNISRYLHFWRSTWNSPE